MCTEEIGGFFDVIYHQLLALRVLCAGCYRISIVLAFLCGLKKTIRIRYEWTRSFWTTEGKNSPSSKISQYVCKGPKIVKISCLFFVSSFRSFQRPLQISLRFHMPQLRFHTPEAWKWYPFRLEPPRMGHYRDTPHRGKLTRNFYWTDNLPRIVKMRAAVSACSHFSQPISREVNTYPTDNTTCR